MRSVLLDRKNHLGSKSQRRTEAGAVLHTLCETAYLNGLDPCECRVESTYATPATAVVDETGRVLTRYSSQPPSTTDDVIVPLFD